MIELALPHSRKILLGVAAGILCAALGSLLIACQGEAEGTIKRMSRGSIVLYVSADDALFRPVIESFEKVTGAKVQVVGDTEATKTFGLVRRLLDEKENPRADVFWASEPLGMIRLAQAGVLQNLSDTVAPGSPTQWIPIAYRARVIAYHSGRFQPGDAPQRLGDLINPRLKGKVGLARPQFGTTRTHMAALLTNFGEAKYLEFVQALKANEARLYDGNSAVVQAIAHGEISAGLTDSDDVVAGQDQQWPISSTQGTTDLDASTPEQSAGGALLMPHVAGVVAGTKHVDLANDFIAYLLSNDVQKLFIQTNAAVLPGEASAFRLDPPVPPSINVGPLSRPDYRTVAPMEAKAVELFERVWGTN